jgi:uncharacterized integral membrane protein
MTQPAENRPPITSDPGAAEPAGYGTVAEPLGETSPDLLPPPKPQPDTSPDLIAPKPERIRVAHTRTSAAWVGVWAGVVVLILLIIFVAQNTASVRISFFNLEGEISLALALLIAGVGGAIISMAVAATRILQLRRMVRRGR